MELKWMQNHRDFVEKLIRYGNTYAAHYRIQADFDTGVSFSPSQIQTLEYILENEDKNEKMSKMAQRLGVKNSAFSKNVSKLMDKGLLEKYQYSDNQKNIYLKATDKGRKVYNEYSQYVYHELFKPIFDIADELDPETVEKFGKMLDIFSDTLIWYGVNKPEPRTLIKLEKK